MRCKEPARRASQSSCEYQEETRAHNLNARALSVATVKLYMHGVMSVEGVYGQRRLDDQVTKHCHPLFISQSSFDLLGSVSD